MQPFPPTFVIRHRKENLKKCSLRGLESRQDFQFFTFPFENIEIPNRYVLLELGAEPLTERDKNMGLLVIDATWRYALKMLERLKPFTKHVERRSLPMHLRTAYPRRQEDCPDPEVGLASIEAIYASYQILGRDTSGLLDDYYWKDAFLKKNNITQSQKKQDIQDI